MTTTHATFADYRAALTAPGARAPVIGSLVGRLPLGMLSFTILLYAQASTGSFAVAGAMTGGLLIGVSFGSVAQGRIMDRLGLTRPLLVTGVLAAVTAAAVVAAVETRQPLPVLVAVTVALGVAHPAIEGASRTVWSVLVPEGPIRTAAYSYEAISLEVFFILGPALAGLLAAFAPWPGVGLVVAGTTMCAGAVGFALCPAVRAVRGRQAGSSVGFLGALARPGMRTVALGALGFGVTVGAAEVGVFATTAAAGSPALGGILLALWSVSSVLVGVLYSRHPWPRPLHLRSPVLVAGFAVAVAMLYPASTVSLALLACVMLVAGGLITPMMTGFSLTIDEVTPPGTGTEALGWVITSATLGAAAGQSVAGVVTETFTPATPFLFGGVGGLLLAAVVWQRRATLHLP